MQAQTYTLSRFTNPNGVFVSQVMLGGLPLIPETIVHDYAEQYARDAFRNARGSAILTHWDGDRGIATTLDEK